MGKCNGRGGEQADRYSPGQKRPSPVTCEVAVGWAYGKVILWGNQGALGARRVKWNRSFRKRACNESGYKCSWRACSVLSCSLCCSLWGKVILWGQPGCILGLVQGLKDKEQPRRRKGEIVPRVSAEIDRAAVLTRHEGLGATREERRR